MPTDGPRDRFRRQRALGATEELALAFVLSSYGLSHNIVRLLPDGSEKKVDPKWTLEQVCHVVFLKVDTRVSGPLDGATRYPWLR